MDDLSNDTQKEEVAKLITEGMDVAVNWVRTPWNFGMQKQMQDWAEDIGVKLNVTPMQNWYNPEEPGWKESHEAVMLERNLSGKRDKPFRFHCPFLNSKKRYYDARGIRHPCCIRMRYDQIFQTEGTCRSCPE
jgi:hypothetical protein